MKQNQQKLEKNLKKKIEKNKQSTCKMAPLSRENSAADKIMDTTDDVTNAPDEVTSTPPAVVGPPPLEIVFSFDTTGSMSSCIAEVR